jgi:hypothetical protein
MVMEGGGMASLRRTAAGPSDPEATHHHRDHRDHRQPRGEVPFCYVSPLG